MAGTAGNERPGDILSFLRGCNCESLTQAGAAGVDPKLLPCLRIDKPEVADFGKLLLAWVADLDREHVVTPGEREKRPPPVERPAEVGDDGD
jgi:hypothetical protein